MNPGILKDYLDEQQALIGQMQPEELFRSCEAYLTLLRGFVTLLSNSEQAENNARIAALSHVKQGKELQIIEVTDACRPILAALNAAFDDQFNSRLIVTRKHLERVETALVNLNKDPL